MMQMNLSTKQKQTQQKNRLVVAKGGGLGRDGWEFGVRRCKRVCIEGINSKILSYSIGTLSNVL